MKRANRSEGREKERPNRDIREENVVICFSLYQLVIHSFDVSMLTNISMFHQCEIDDLFFFREITVKDTSTMSEQTPLEWFDLLNLTGQSQPSLPPSSPDLSLDNQVTPNEEKDFTFFVLSLDFK